MTVEVQAQPPSGRKQGFAVAFFAQMLAIGITSFSYGLFVEPLSSAFGLSRTDANSGLILIIVGMAIWSPMAGKALDKMPAQRVLVAGALLFGGGLVITAMSQNVLLTAITAVTLIAGGASALGPIAGATLAARWFTQHRGRALGIMATSSSMGGFAMVPVLGLLMGAAGWRSALMIMGASIAVLLSILVVLSIRGDAGVPPAKLATHAGTPSQRQFTTGQLLAERDLWLLVAVIGGMMAISQALLVSLIPYATDRGIALKAASLLVAAASISAIAGKLVIGALADRVDLRWLQIFVVAMMGLFLAMLLSDPVYPVLLATCLIGGVAIGGTTPLWAAFVSMRFGASSVGSVMGLMVLLQMPIIFIALRFTGAVFDRTGNYNLAFLTFFAILPLIAIAIFPVKRPHAKAAEPQPA